MGTKGPGYIERDLGNQVVHEVISMLWAQQAEGTVKLGAQSRPMYRCTVWASGGE